MKIATHTHISNLDIKPVKYMEWVEYVIKDKYNCIVPSKEKIYMENNVSRFTTMPAYIPSIHRMGVKVGASRFPNEVPAIDTSILIYSSLTGELIGLLDAHLVTSMRTGAVAALSVKTLKVSQEITTIGLMGLGVTARAMLLCLLDASPNERYVVKLLEYKDQADLFIERFQSYKNVTFKVVKSNEELICDSDVIVSAITVAEGQIGRNEWFKKGCTLVPIHTRGFENCDLFFDRVFGDVREQIEIFGNFKKFKEFNEFSEIFINQCDGRRNDEERILVYNIGMGLHDVYIGSKILDLLGDTAVVEFKEKLPKFYV